MMWMDDKKSKKKKKSKIVKNKHIKSRRDAIIADVPEVLRKIWFSDKESAIQYANWLIEQDELQSESLLSDKNVYAKIEKAKKHIKPAKNTDDIIRYIRERNSINKRFKPSRRLKNIDRGVAKILNPNKYCKTYLAVDDYRKQIKNLAKLEKAELKEIEKMGYDTSKEVEAFKKRVKCDDTVLKASISDAYYYKHKIE